MSLIFSRKFVTSTKRQERGVKISPRKTRQNQSEASPTSDDDKEEQTNQDINAPDSPKKPDPRGNKRTTRTPPASKSRKKPRMRKAPVEIHSGRSFPMLMMRRQKELLLEFCNKIHIVTGENEQKELFRKVIDNVIDLAKTDFHSTRLTKRLAMLLRFVRTNGDIEGMEDTTRAQLQQYKTVHRLMKILTENFDNPLQDKCQLIMQDVIRGYCECTKTG